MNIIFKTQVNASNVNANITSFYVNQPFIDDILVFIVTTQNKPKTWNSAGFLTQFIDIGGKLVNIKSQRILLDEYLCIKPLNISDKPYYIHFNPENWLTDVSLKVYSVDEELSQALADDKLSSTSDTALIIRNLTQSVLASVLYQRNNASNTDTLSNSSIISPWLIPSNVPRPYSPLLPGF